MGDGLPGAPAASEAKGYRGGTHRAVAPAATLARITPLLPAMGITRVANVTGLDRLGIPVYMACRPLSRAVAVAQGKGASKDEARISAIMEAVETFHAERITAPLRFASEEELAAELPLIDVAGLPRTTFGSHDPRRPILWLEGVELIGGQALWLPFELISTNYTLPQPPGSFAFPANTNGLAAGNTRDEAALHALSELIERDAMALWRLGGAAARAATRLDPATIDHEPAQALLARFAAAGVAIGLWDVSADIGVPVVCCVGMDVQDGETEPEIGAGCHPAREVALLRALTEVAQGRTTRIAGARDDFAPASYGLAAKTSRQAAAADWLRAPITRRFAAVPTLATASIAADLAAAIARLQAVGIRQVVRVDLTKPALGIPVVRMVVPGLEGAYPGLDSDYVPGARARARGLRLP